MKQINLYVRALWMRRVAYNQCEMERKPISRMNFERRGRKKRQSVVVPKEMRCYLHDGSSSVHPIEKNWLNIFALFIPQSITLIPFMLQLQF